MNPMNGWTDGAKTRARIDEARVCLYLYVRIPIRRTPLGVAVRLASALIVPLPSRAVLPLELPVTEPL